jgi:hypothetical protein
MYTTIQYLRSLCDINLVCHIVLQGSALTDSSTSSNTIALSDQRQQQQQQQQQQWGGSCLQIAFNSLKLVVDDFLDRVPPTAIPLLVRVCSSSCLSIMKYTAFILMASRCSTFALHGHSMSL